MTRRSYLLSKQRIDLVQRRRSRSATLFSEQPVPIDIRRLSGAGEGAGQAAAAAAFSWLSPVIGWMDDEMSWLL